MLASFEMMARIALMRHVLVNTNKRGVPPELIKRWLDYVTGQRESSPCADCQSSQLAECRWTCLRR